MQLGVIGLGTMGANLARNAARNGATVALYNRTPEKTAAFTERFGTEGDFIACDSYAALAAALQPPRAVLIMVKAGQPVDDVIEELLPHLDKGDVLIDGGNSHYTDTSRRVKALQTAGIECIGMGVSGGEEGALNGPSLMPGGSKKGWMVVEPLFTKMAADDGAGGKCVTFVGAGGAGHFVKMVHNGIEYGVMQLIAETYDFLKTVGGLQNTALAKTFTAWNKSALLSSFLIESTAKVFEKKDDQSDGDLIDMIADRAGQKGTGKWTTEAAFNYGVAVPTITAAVDARILSGSVKLREQSKMLPSYPREISFKGDIIASAQSALEQSIIFAYEQGFALMRVAGTTEDWGLDMGEIARIWRGGCIVRSSILDLYVDSYAGGDAAKKAFETIINCFSQERQTDWRQVVEQGIAAAVPLPAMSASLSYFDALSRDRLPQNLVQALRDLFGAHTYERTDREGVFHTDWEG